MRLFDDVRRKVLSNGLEILVREDKSAPVVALNFFVRVGSLNEDDAIAGWSHGIEHMLFKGTARRGPGDIAREIQDAGGDTNAGTGYESTNYYIILPAENFGTALDIHADVLRNSVFDERELENERQVLIKENEMYRDRPSGFGYTWESLLSEGFTTHRYQRPIGGPDENLLRVGRDAIVEYKDRYYRPGNITYVVVGDVKADEVFQAMEEKFGDWPGGEMQPDVSPREPVQNGFRFCELWRDVEKSYAKLGYHIPEERHEDTDALLMLSHILASGKTSRLYRHVREEQGLIYDSTVLQVTGKDPGYLVFDFSCEPDKTEAALAAVYKEIERVRREPITTEELHRALHAVRCDTVFTAETMEGQASMLGHYALLGDYRWANEYLDRLAALTPEHLLAVARKYLSLEQSTALILWPEGDRPSLGGSGVVADRLSEALKDLPAEKADSGAAGDGAKPALTASGRPRGAVEVTTLSTGTRVVWQADGRLPLAALALYLPGGSGVETPEEAGLAQLTQVCMTKGAGGLTAQQLADAQEDIGARLRPFTTRDACGFGLSVVRDHFDTGLDLLERILTTPDFPEDAVHRERERFQAHLRALRDDTVQFTVSRFYRQLFAGHAYGRPVLGTEDTLGSFEPEALRNWHKDLYDPARMVVSVVGDADRDRVLGRLETMLGGLKGSRDSRTPATPHFPERPSREVITKEVSQAVVVLGYPGPDHQSPDRYALDVWNGVMSGMGNRLFASLRDEKHLCYFTGSFAVPLATGGALGAYVGTGAEQVDEALDALLHELEAGVKTPPSEQEIRRAKNTLAGSHLIDMQTRMAWASTYASDEVIGLGYQESERYLEAIRRVTAEEARAAAARYVDPERLVVAVLRPAEVAEIADA